MPRSMRLTCTHIDLILRRARDVLGPDAQVTLLGSRADELLRGGDVDLPVAVPRGRGGASRAQRTCGTSQFARHERTQGGRAPQGPKAPGPGHSSGGRTRRERAVGLDAGLPARLRFLSRVVEKESRLLLQTDARLFAGQTLSDILESLDGSCIHAGAHRAGQRLAGRTWVCADLGSGGQPLGPDSSAVHLCGLNPHPSDRPEKRPKSCDLGL
jgi:hypothetical protein